MGQSILKSMHKNESICLLEMNIDSPAGIGRFLFQSSFAISICISCPYNVENVRIRYEANNDTRGFVYGLDLRLNGEFFLNRVVDKHGAYVNRRE